MAAHQNTFDTIRDVVEAMIGGDLEDEDDAGDSGKGEGETGGGVREQGREEVSDGIIGIWQS
jgi:hypothetical protein